MKVRLLILSLSTLALAVACDSSSSSGTGGNNGGGGGGGGGGGNNNPATARPGGGTSGGAVNGQFDIFTIETNNGVDTPIANANIIVEAGGQTFEGTTDAMGQASFSDAAITAPVTVHAFATGYTFSSIVGLGARTLTLPLEKPGNGNTNTQTMTAQATGMVTGFDSLGAGNQIALVMPYGDGDLDTNVMQPDRMGSGFAQNTAAKIPAAMIDVTDYTLDFDVRAKGFVVQGGTLDPMTMQPNFTHLGFATGISATAGGMIMQDLNLSHPLDQAFMLTATGSSDFDDISVAAQLVMPNDGGQIFLSFAQAATANMMFPALTGPIENATIGVVAIFGNSADDSVSAFVSSPASGSSATLTAPALPGAPTVSGRTLTIMPTSGAIFTGVTIGNGMNDLWDIAIFSGTEVTLPAVPMGHTDVLTGSLEVSADSIFREGVDVNDLSIEAFERAGVTQWVASRSAMVMF